MIEDRSSTQLLGVPERPGYFTWIRHNYYYQAEVRFRNPLVPGGRERKGAETYASLYKSLVCSYSMYGRW